MIARQTVALLLALALNGTVLLAAASAEAPPDQAENDKNLVFPDPQDGQAESEDRLVILP